MQQSLFGWTGLLAVACCVGGLAASTARAASLNVVGGQLVGASDVQVGLRTYDVTFEDGSCISLFNGCDDTSDFDFVTPAGAQLAAQALFDQVFINDPLGNFDTNPTLTSGCSDPLLCGAIIPFAHDFVSDTYDAVVGENRPVTDTGTLDLGLQPDGLTGNSNVFARFTVVPEPGTGLLLAAGLALLAARRRAPAAR